ncbi:protein phosphatase 2C domain-containing protein [Singulisphaera sp. PoT]|uniref:PP2C family serine/threonine-protein phosphatase n=1 Tax=Singulisphaera sp. PoT TaxID=3411797 RepID=UPI003BF4F897
MINREGELIEDGKDPHGGDEAPAELQVGASAAAHSDVGPSGDLLASTEATHDSVGASPSDQAPASPSAPTEAETHPRSVAEPSTPPSLPTAPSVEKKPPGPPKQATPSLNIQFQIPNGMVGKAYNAIASAGVHKSSELPRGYRPEDVSVRPLRVDGLEPLGLHEEPDGQELRIVGEPKVAGDHPIVVHFSVLLRGEVWVRAQKQVVLTINPDPRSLWKDIEPDPNSPFRRPHVHHFRVEAEAVLLGASRRGRSHANKGEHRDDDFRIAHARGLGWYALAVADGAGSAPVSRRGAEIACKSSVDSLKTHLTTTFDESFQKLVESYAGGDEASREALHDALLRSLGDGGRGAYQAVLAEAMQHGRPIEHFATTLILTIARRYPCGWFIATIAVGDGAAGAYRANGEVVVLNRPDTGEFAGQTRFLTMPKIWADDSEVRSRIRFAVVPDLVGIVAMTDGVSDPKFPTDRDLADPARWQAFWGEISGAVGLNKTNTQAASELLDWLGFWAVGNHDDRTIALLLP